MKAFEPAWVFDRWVDGAACRRCGEELVDAGEWSPLHGRLMILWGDFQMWLFGWWKAPAP